MLISHALPIWNGLLHRRTDRCAAKGHLNASSYREGDINVFCCNYRTVTRGKRSAILIPLKFTIVPLSSFLLDLVSRREQGEGKDEIPRSRKEPGIRMRDRWSLDAVTNEYFSKRYIGKVRREPGVYGRLVKVWIDEPIKLRKITSSIWEPHRGRVNNELKINGITRLCVYW